MKTMLFFAALAALVYSSGCSHVELTPMGEGSAERVLTGNVLFGARIEDEERVVITVRLLDNSQPGMPVVLDEQRIVGVGTPPVPFRLEFTADDMQLRRGLNLDARVAVNGRLRFHTVRQHLVTLANATEPHEVRVELVGGARE